MSNRVVHFEIYADDMARAQKFYEQVFGWQFQSYGEMPNYGEYVGVTTGDSGEGINGGMFKRGFTVEAGDANAFVCTVQVDNYDAVHEKIMAAGGQEMMAKFALPGMAWQGYHKDTEGNTFGLHRPDENAA